MGKEAMTTKDGSPIRFAGTGIEIRSVEGWHPISGEILLDWFLNHADKGYLLKFEGATAPAWDRVLLEDKQLEARPPKVLA